MIYFFSVLFFSVLNPTGILPISFFISTLYFFRLKINKSILVFYLITSIMLIALSMLSVGAVEFTKVFYYLVILFLFLILPSAIKITKKNIFFSINILFYLNMLIIIVDFLLYQYLKIDIHQYILSPGGVIAGGDVFRSRGFMSEPVDVGIALNVLLGLKLIINSMSESRMKLYDYALIAISIILVRSASQIAIFFILFLLSNNVLKYYKAIFIFLFISIFVVNIFDFSYLIDTIVNKLFSESGSGRYIFWDYYFKILFDNPLLGVGDINHGFLVYPATNFYLHFSTLYGMPALLVYLLLILYYVFRTWSFYTKINRFGYYLSISSFINLLSMSVIFNPIVFFGLAILFNLKVRMLANVKSDDAIVIPAEFK
jgi:hypothetical protein